MSGGNATSLPADRALHSAANGIAATCGRKGHRCQTASASDRTSVEFLRSVAIWHNMASKRILMLVGDYVEDYEVTLPFQALQMLWHTVHAIICD